MMNKWKKRIILPVTAAAILLAAVPAYGNTYEAVYDNASLLTEDEKQSLSEKVVSLEQKTNWDIYVLTTEDAEGKTSRAVADDFYDANASGESGVVLLIDMDNREVTVSTAGDAIYYLNDDRIDDILDDGYAYVADGEYDECFSVMLSDVEYYYDKGIPSNAYTYDEETGKIKRYHSITFVEILIAIALAGGVWAVIYFGVTGKYRLKFGNYTYDYHSFGKVNLSGQEDRFVNEFVTQHRIQTNQGGSGGSSHSGRSTVHRSSSGRSHGGGSRKF